MYVSPNFRSKKAFKEALAAGSTIRAFSPGSFGTVKNGTVFIEGPHFPATHTWYAECVVVNGVITKVVR